MIWFFRLTLVYLAAAVLIVLLTRGTEIPIFLHVITPAFYLGETLVKFSVGLIGAAVILVSIVGPKTAIQRLPGIGFALISVIVMQCAFTLLKTTMPTLTPFFADGFFAKLDRALHFGVDPWVFTHWFALPPVMAHLGATFYITVWLLPALAFPALLAALDSHEARKTRYLILYVMCWIALGNILAFAGLSAGPVYYDDLYGGTEFAGLTGVLESSGINATVIGEIQAGLWNVYITNSQAVGSGISAFPSVHVAIATVVALYMAERSRWLMPIGAAFLLIILFMSVYSGFHYALDGYFSIAFVVAANFALRRYHKRSRA